MVSEEVRSFFPHEQIRAVQDQLITDLEYSISEKKILLAHAPTGLGKTASALSVALLEGLKNKKKVFFLTNRHTQHEIAIDTLKLIKEKTGKDLICTDLIGKRWMCNQDIAGLFGNEFNEFCKSIVEKGECEFLNNVKSKGGITVEAKLLISEFKKKGINSSQEIIAYCHEKKMCSYEISLILAKKADIIIGDYNYIFNPFVQKNLFSKLDLKVEDIILIVDEGHNLPARIAEMLSSKLNGYMIKNAIIEAKKFGYNGLIFWLQEMMTILNRMADFSSGFSECEKLVKKEDFVNQVEKVVDYNELINEIEVAADEIRKKQRKSYLSGISAFLESWNGQDNGYARIISEKEGKQGAVIVLSYECLDPSILTKDIFKRVYSGIVMSGTLRPMFMYKDVLGIENSFEKEYSSPFPPENKLSLIVPKTTTKYNLRSEGMYQQIAEECIKICQLIPGNIALFFPSYQLRDCIGRYFKSEKKLFWEKSELSKEEKEKLLHDFKAEQKTGAVLLGVTGANFAEGVDFPGDLLKAVVVVGLPLGRPNLKTKETINYYEHKFARGWDYGYIYPAMNKCFQSSGRCIRSENDRGAVIFLDERFTWKSYFCCFPKEGLKVVKDYEQFLVTFFS